MTKPTRRNSATGLESANSRHGLSDRRDRWTFWWRLIVVGFLVNLASAAGGFVVGAGIPADALAESDTRQAEVIEQMSAPIMDQLAALRDSLLANPRVIERTIRVPYPVVEVEYRDTLYLPGPAPEPQIVEIAVAGPPVPGPVRIMEIPVVQPAGVCFDPHSFTSSHTFRPSIGTFGWGAAGFLLGLLVTVEATAEAEVYVQ